MCTVTFVARKQGYILGMNRDEQLTRAPAVPPAEKKINGGFVLCPAEAGGGTWIAVNDAGATFALINWYAIAARVERNPVSRGIVVNAVGAAIFPKMADAALAGLPLMRINPFRLIGIYPGSRAVVEWRWNLEKLARQRHPWETRQWISSGFDEPAAQHARGKTFRDFRSQSSFGSLAWLRRLHGSHAPEAGPFSTCMHRADAATVSYTEVSVLRGCATMSYHQGAPCLRHPLTVLRAELVNGRGRPGA